MYDKYDYKTCTDNSTRNRKRYVRDDFVTEVYCLVFVKEFISAVSLKKYETP